MTAELLTKSGRRVSEFCFGTMQFGGKADATQSRALFEACREAGITHFDTAFAYTNGASERLLGAFAAHERDDLFIATKCAHPGNAAPDLITEQFDESLARLDMDYVDLLYLHRWDDGTPLELTFEALAKMVEAGRVRHIGLSNFAAWQVMKAVAVAKEFSLTITALQPMYNLVKRQAEVEILPMALSESIAILPYSPLGGGLLTGKYNRGNGGRLKDDAMYAARYGQDWMHKAAQALHEHADKAGVSPITLAVAWVARHPGVTGPIISASNPDQLQPSLDAIDFTLSDEAYAALSGLTPTPPPATDRSEEA
ncbi:MAG: aldo/keto reductase [Pseudomonadota bacterium]